MIEVIVGEFNPVATGQPIMVWCANPEILAGTPIQQVPELYFSAEFLSCPPVGWDVDLPGPPEGAKEGDEVDVTGGLIKLAGMVWQLTGEFDEEHLAYRGGWPD